MRVLERSLNRWVLEHKEHKGCTKNTKTGWEAHGILCVFFLIFKQPKPHLMVCPKSTIVFTLLFFIGPYFAHCQNPSIDSTIIGVWKGTSICQLQNTSCQDEIVVYYITKSRDVDSFSVKANKIIDGREQEMGVLLYKLDRKNKRLISNDNGALWKFDLKNRELSGTLFYKGTFYRIIKLTKQ